MKVLVRIILKAMDVSRSLRVYGVGVCRAKARKENAHANAAPPSPFAHLKPSETPAQMMT